MDLDEIECWYSEQCLKHQKGCKKSCYKYDEIKSLMDKALIPIKMQKVHKMVVEACDKESFSELYNIKCDMKSFVAQGKSLYIFGKNTGNGKSTSAVKLLQTYFDEIYYGNRFRTRGLFISVPDFMSKLRQIIKYPDDDFNRLLQLIKEVDLVIWDEIAANNTKEYDIMTLLGLIEHRISNNKSNIYTSNCNQVEMNRILDDRLYSRIWQLSVKIELKGIDKRYM